MTIGRALAQTMQPQGAAQCQSCRPVRVCPQLGPKVDEGITMAVGAGMGTAVVEVWSSGPLGF